MTDDKNADGWALVLVPLSFIYGRDDLTGELRITAEAHCRRAVEICSDSTTAEQKNFYQLLLKISWLPPALRRAVMAELGLSLRKQKRDIEEGGTIGMRFLIEQRKKAMQAQRLRPRGGIHEAAVAEIACEKGMTVAALKKRLQRYKQRQKN